MSKVVDNSDREIIPARIGDRRAEDADATPRPWKVFTARDGRKLVGIGSLESGGGICDAGFGMWSWDDAEGIANAHLIVRVVNNHDELVAALKIAQQWMPLPTQAYTPEAEQEAKLVAAAIKRAEGG